MVMYSANDPGWPVQNFHSMGPKPIESYEVARPSPLMETLPTPMPKMMIPSCCRITSHAFFRRANLVPPVGTVFSAKKKRPTHGMMEKLEFLQRF